MLHGSEVGLEVGKVRVPNTVIYLQNYQSLVIQGTSKPVMDSLINKLNGKWCHQSKLAKKHLSCVCIHIHVHVCVCMWL